MYAHAHADMDICIFTCTRAGLPQYLSLYSVKWHSVNCDVQTLLVICNLTKLGKILKSSSIKSPAEADQHRMHD